MKLDFNLKPWLAASKDLSRPLLGDPWLNVEESRIEASDSFVAMMMPVLLDPQDVSGSIPREALAWALRRRGDQGTGAGEIRMICEQEHVTCLPSGVRFPRPEHKPGNWPDIGKILEEAERPKPVVEFGIDARKLAQLAEAFNAWSLKVTIYDPEGAIKVEPSHSAAKGCVAMVMPVRLRGSLPPTKD